MIPSDYFRDLPTLRTKRLLLRKLTVTDARDMFAYASNPAVARLTAWTAHETVQDSIAFLTESVNRYEKGQPVGYGIVDAQLNHLIGTGGICEWSEPHSRGELGYAIAEPYWRKGYMTEAAAAIIDSAFRLLPMNRLQACCNVENIGSARVMEKLGMKFEGVLRQHVKLQGRYCDVKYYSIMRSEWDAQAAASRII